MKAVFADAWFYVALIHERDANHHRVVNFAGENESTLVTTRWVLAEVANALSKAPARAQAVALLQTIESDPSTRVVKSSDSLFDHGQRLYERRPDKEWSLTDCISFVVMEQEALREALTNDHHFGQAGFVALFADRS